MEPGALRHQQVQGRVLEDSFIEEEAEGVRAALLKRPEDTQALGSRHFRGYVVSEDVLLCTD